ncbi:MAG: glycoside hydrolase family 5 protein [Oscillospiraceae bacterium]|jgi:aryl-phospho-beta-D-glucosidase BglC (GH1 family)|nr:glycoside hydrolase family 5 protein [Oscillospiraceae bacterium]
MILDKYRAGINLGGWISQCREMTPEHIASFIKKENIGQIAAWGLDHVRLPFDYPVLEDDGNPFVYKENGFAVIDKLIAWCREFNLGLVLDMHKAPGYSFGNYKTENALFTDETTLNRFVSLWCGFAERYKNEGDNVIFELLNEIVDPHGDTWNKIARKAIEGIRGVDADRHILLGGPHYNSAAGLETLEIYSDERILYNFHFYEPFLFTHQRARWTSLKDTGIVQPYPGNVAGIDILKEQAPDHLGSMTAETVFDFAFLEERLAPAIKFMNKTGKRLYCGEYGAIALAGTENRVNYLQDKNALFDKYKISRAYWNYKGLDYSSIDENGEAVSPELVRAIGGKI